MVSTNEPRVLEKSVFDLGKRVKRVRNSDEARAIFLDMHQIGQSIPRNGSVLRARWLFLNGVYRSKMSTTGLLPTVSSEIEHAQIALEFFAEASTHVEELLQTGSNAGLLELSRKCAYEAAVTCTQLFKWNATPRVILSYNSLPSAFVVKVTHAVRKGSALPSRF